jgi:carbon monoxide dehydrogenase subunit G
MRAENSVLIARPIEDVFGFLAVPQNNEQWMSAVVATKRTATEPVTLGETFQHTVKFLGRTFDVTFEVIELDSPTRYSVRNNDGPIEFRGSYQLEQSDDKTRFTFVLEGDPGNFFRFGMGMVERTARRQFATDLATLNEVLTAEPVQLDPINR